MKTKLKVAFALLFTGIFAGSFFMTPATAVAEASGGFEQRSVYNTNCASCHGRDGHSNTAKGRELDADDLTTGKVKGMSAATMARIIRNGKGDMPGFGKRLSATQITALVKFVKTL